MFVKKRTEVKKEFNSRDRAEGFATGLEFSGTRDYRVKNIVEEDNKVFVILEKLEKSKV